MNVDQFLHNLWANNQTYSDVIAGYKSPKRGIAQVSRMSGFTKTLPATGLIDERFLDDLSKWIAPVKSVREFAKETEEEHERNAIEKVVAPIEHYPNWGSW